MAITYKTKFKKREEAAEGTMSFYFEKPEGFEFKAGQAMDITIPNPPYKDDKGNMRTYSIASAPSEMDLMITTRMRDSAFKKTLKEMIPGWEVGITAPTGSFTLHNNPSVPAVFLMGGIGITPARSIVLEASKKRLPHTIYLFYSNRRPEDAAFLDDLNELKLNNPNYKFIPTMTQIPESHKPWIGETGYIDVAMLKRYIPDVLLPIYYTAGPQEMVSAMRIMLNNTGVNDDNIRTEEFSGY